MDFFRGGKMRWLYVLALAQLVGGPLVLLQVTLFCKLALHEAPRVGMARAAAIALDANDLHAALAMETPSKPGERKSPTPGEPKMKLEKAKMPAIPWEPAPLVLTAFERSFHAAECARTWTPAWPQAPPGPPPRLG